MILFLSLSSYLYIQYRYQTYSLHQTCIYKNKRENYNNYSECARHKLPSCFLFSCFSCSSPPFLSPSLLPHPMCVCVCERARHCSSHNYSLLSFLFFLLLKKERERERGRWSYVLEFISFLYTRKICIDIYI